MSHFSEIIAKRMQKAGDLINAHMSANAHKAPEVNFLVKGLNIAMEKCGLKLQPHNQFMARWDAVARIVGFTTEWNGTGGLFDPLVRDEKPLEGVAVGELVKTTDDHGRKVLIFMTALGPVVIFQRYNAEDNFTLFAHLPEAVAELLKCDTSGSLDRATYKWLTEKDNDVIKRVEAAMAKKTAAKTEEAKSEDKAPEDEAGKKPEAKTEAPNADQPTADDVKEAVGEFADAVKNMVEKTNEASQKIVEPTTDVGRAFQQHLRAITNVVDFVPAWHGETEYFEGVARGTVFMEPLGEKPVKTVDSMGRSVILMQTAKGMIVIFERFTDQVDTIKVQMHEELAKLFKVHQTEEATVDLLLQLLGDPNNPERTTAIDMVKLMNNLGNGKKH